MKHKTFLSALAGILAVLCLSGCGSYNLKTVQLSAQAATTTGGLYDLKGEGGTLQLQASGEYSNNTSKDITPRVTYTVVPDGTGAPVGNLLPPPQTVTISSTGLMTAVDPFVCSWVNVGTATAPKWALSGSYKVTATFQGVTSQPIYVAVAAAVVDPSGQCGP